MWKLISMQGSGNKWWINAMVHSWPWLFGHQTKSELINTGKGLDWRRRLVRTGRGLETVEGENSWNILLTRMKLVEKINH